METYDLEFSRHFNIGRNIAATIRLGLGPNIEYQDHEGQIARLRANLEPLENCYIDAYETSSLTVEAATTLSASGLTLAKKQSLTALNRGKVLIPGELDDQPQWVTIELQDRKAFSPVISDQSTEPDEELTSLVDNYMSDHFYESVNQNDPISNAIIELRNSMPQMTLREVQLLGRLSLIQQRTNLNLQIPYRSEQEVKKVSRLARKLNDLIEGLLADPQAFLAQEGVNAMNQSELEDIGFRLFNRRISYVNQLVFNSVKSDHKPLPRAPKIFIPENIESTELKQTQKGELIDQNIEELSILNGIVASISWINEGTPTEAKTSKLKTPYGEAVIVDGITEGKFNEISEESRQKWPATGNNLNVFDYIAKKVASALASGMQPFQINSLGFIKTSEASVYQGMPIWYPREVGSNAQRLYFTVKKAAEVFSDEVLQSNGLNADTPALIIVAETDKARQIDVLEVLTGRTRRHLRAWGAGSV